MHVDSRTGAVSERGGAGRVAVVARRVASDLAAVLLAFGIGYGLYLLAISAHLLDRTPNHLQYLGASLFFGVLVIVVFHHLGLYGERASVLNLRELESAVKGVLVAAAFFLATLFFFKVQTFSRLVIVGSVCLSMGTLLAERRLMAGLLRRRLLRGLHGRRVLIYGCGETGRLLMKKIVEAPHLGRTVVGFLDGNAAPGTIVTCRITQTGSTLFTAPVLGRIEDLARIARGVDELLLTSPSTDAHELEWILSTCRESKVGVGIVPHLGDMRFEALEVQDLSAIPILRLRPGDGRRRSYALGKRVLDVVGAAGLLVVTWPVWVVAALAIRIDSSGPVFFPQYRVGLGGRPFRMFKFRTMVSTAEPYAISPFSDTESRVTRVGRFLRATGIDELPQLVNVVLGHMSLVGPRPEMPFIVERYTALQRERLAVKPGITGLWQLSPDRHLHIHENIEYDLYYLHHRTLLFDALILFETLVFTVEATYRHLTTSVPTGGGDPGGEVHAGGTQPAATADTIVGWAIPAFHRRRALQHSGGVVMRPPPPGGRVPEPPGEAGSTS